MDEEYELGFPEGLLVANGMEMDAALRVAQAFRHGEDLRAPLLNSDMSETVERILKRLENHSQYGKPNIEVDRIRDRLTKHLTPIERELNMEFDWQMPAEDRAYHVMQRLLNDRRKLLMAVAEALQTLALVLEAENQ
ncbi:MAG: hypothetical protein Q9157_009231, partial [Trypethelium eluteriae]